MNESKLEVIPLAANKYAGASSTGLDGSTTISQSLVQLLPGAPQLLYVLSSGGEARTCAAHTPGRRCLQLAGVGHCLAHTRRRTTVRTARGLRACTAGIARGRASASVLGGWGCGHPRAVAMVPGAVAAVAGFSGDAQPPEELRRERTRQW